MTWRKGLHGRQVKTSQVKELWNIATPSRHVAPCVWQDGNERDNWVGANIWIECFIGEKTTENEEIVEPVRGTLFILLIQTIWITNEK